MKFLTNLMCLCALLGCKSTDKSIASDEESAMVAEFEKKGCRGYCPKYTIQLFADQSIRFIGERNVAEMSTQQRKLTNEEWTSTMRILRSEDVASLDSLYDNGIVDAPFFHLKIQQESGLHHVSCRGDAPKAFAGVERHLESLAQVNHWIEAEVVDRKELILLLKEEAAVTLLPEKYAQIHLTLVKRISPRQLYYVFSVSNDDLSDAEIVALLEEDPDIKSIQWNRQIERRDR
ncbi:MAG: hypothetical protein KTR24_06510 [Saprospiraceae bacterium]|nr:hypothetical protein [Saprospiraceae bacterium]